MNINRDDVPAHEYKLVHGDFGWHVHGQLQYLTSEVAILIDRSLGEGSAIVLKHGAPDLVDEYQKRMAHAFSRLNNKSGDFIIVSSRAWDLEELHKILFNTGYINLWLKRKKDEEHAYRKTPLFAGAGPRSIPEGSSFQLDIMERIGARIRELGGYMRLGHSGQCDMAFERGARERSILYLPFPGFNINVERLTRHISILTELDQRIRQEAARSVVELHPSRGNTRSRHGFLCLARNYLIVMGQENTPVDGLIYWGIPLDDHGNVKGGTGQTVRFAMSRNVPVYNLYNMNEQQIMAKLEQPVATG